MTVLCIRSIPGVLWFWICLAVNRFCDLFAAERMNATDGESVPGNDRMKRAH
jgi:hypothetical protein